MSVKVNTKSQFEKITKKWKENTSLAKTFVKERGLYQMYVAGLAIEVCTITWGGNFKNKSEVYTIKQFAEETGLVPKTLYNWIAVRKNVFDKLTKKNQSLANYEKLSQTYRRVDNVDTRVKVNKTFEKVKGSSSDDVKVIGYLKSLRSLAHNFESKGFVDNVSKEVLEETYFYSELIISNLKQWDKNLVPIDHNETKKYGYGSYSINDAFKNKKGKVLSSGGEKVNITLKDTKILSFMNKNKGKFFTPTEIGLKLSGLSKSSSSAWAHRSLVKLQDVGYVKKGKRGTYSLNL